MQEILYEENGTNTKEARQSPELSLTKRTPQGQLPQKQRWNEEALLAIYETDNTVEVQ